MKTIDEIEENMQKIQALVGLYDNLAREQFSDEDELEHAARKMKHIKKRVLEICLANKKALHSAKLW